MASLLSAALGYAMAQAADQSDALTEPVGGVARQAAAGLPPGVYCPDCGYNLRALTGQRCPECGFDLRSVQLTRSGIPWVHRKQLGAFAAYWKTVGLVARAPERLVAHLGASVDLADAVRFGRINLAIACLSVCLVLSSAAVLLARQTQPPRMPSFWLGLAGLGVAAYYVVLAIVLAARLFVLLSLRDLPEDIWPRAVALRYYCLAPFSLMPIAAVMCAAGLLLWPAGQAVDVLLITPGAGCAATMVWKCVSVRLKLRRQLRPHLGTRRWGRFFALLGETMLLAVALVSVPPVVLWLALIWHSLR
jgi:hypothetical protein